MIFNSYEYIFLFVPIILILYFLLGKYKNGRLSIFLLTIASLFFYAYWKPKFLFIILSSILINYCCAVLIFKYTNVQSLKKTVTIIGVLFNVLLLVYFKYTNFIFDIANSIFPLNLSNLKIILPLGISFFTFTQIAFIIDCYKEKVQDANILNYFLFVTFFPHLLAGPIIHHSEMMPQFSNANNKKVKWFNIYGGLCLFSLGLFKKVVIADYFVATVDKFFLQANTSTIHLWDAWTATLGYSVQIYYDFSGYTDMALGVALLFNIILPINFNSPYKATSIQDFWRRWHMTLSRFLRDYIYIPLGGNRINPLRTEFNIIAVFIIGGIWHGAGFTFIIWGILHALGYAITKIWSIINNVTLQMKLNKIFCIVLTFMFVNLAWVFFRAANLQTANSILKSMLNINKLGTFNGTLIPIILILIMSMIAPNSSQITEFVVKRGFGWSWGVVMLFWISLIYIGINNNTPFIYFQF